MKRYIVLFLLLAYIVTITGCNNADISDNEPSEQITATEKVKTDVIPMVMVKGDLYYDTGKESEIDGRCGLMDGEITSSVDGSEIPTEDNQSNFGTGYEYQIGTEGQIEIYINKKWFIFEKRNGDDKTILNLGDVNGQVRNTLLDEAIMTAILEQNAGVYYPGEFKGAGYLIFETFIEDKITSVYALTEYIEYGFQDNYFVNVSGTRVKVLFNFETNQDESYNLVDYISLDVTSGLSEERIIELLQLLKETGKDYTYTDKELQELREMVDTHAEEYLKSIGKQASVRQRDPHQENSLLALGVKEEVYFTLTKDEKINLYPEWNGNLERLENGVRFLYQTEYDKVDKKITYTKTQYDTNDIVEKLIFNALNGEQIE